jgi:ribosome recycling factor
MEARSGLLNTASKNAEDTRVQIRKTRDAVVRKYKWKSSTDSDEISQVFYPFFFFQGHVSDL